jgi:hypothetical protein
MLYQVNLYEVTSDMTERLHVARDGLNARKSLKLYREVCAIGRKAQADGEWHSWKAERASETGLQVLIGKR